MADSLESILKDLREQLLANVDAQSIADDACDKEIIPEKLKTSINQAKSVREANMILYQHLLQQGTQSKLKELCTIMINAKGYGRMNEFGQVLQTKAVVERQHTGFTQEGEGEGGIPPSQTVALLASPAFPGPPQQTPVRGDQFDTPKMSFAVLTANKREELAVNGFLGLECVDEARYPHASMLQYRSDAVLMDAGATVVPLEDPRYTHRLFSLEVNGNKQVGVHVYCDKMGPWGAFHKTVELLKTARDKNWKLRYIFIVGCCGASVTEAKKKYFPRGTILLAEQVKDYLNTGKVEEECEEDIAEEMVLGRAPTFKVKGSPTTYQMDSALLTQMIGVQEMNTQGAFNRIEAKTVDYLSGPLVIKSSLFGDTFRDRSVDACGVEMEAVGVLKAVETFHTLFSGPKAEVVLAKGISDYTGRKGESGSCKFYEREIDAATDDQLQMNASMQSIALVIRLVAKKMTWLFNQ